MLERVRATVTRYDLLSPGQRVVVGVSGGPDSVVLLHVLLQLREEFRLELHVAHLNHQLRGEEAEADAAFVAALAASWGLPCLVERRDVPSLAAAGGLSPEEAARLERYRFLTGLARRLGDARVAVGHQADDQAETVLLQLLQGGGSAALGAMAPRRGIIIRPLLEVTRGEVEAYREANGLPARFDSTNRDLRYPRNRIRQELIPLLREHYNPRVVEALNRTALLLRDEDELLERLAGREWERLARMEAPGKVLLPWEALAGLPVALRRRLVRRGHAQVAGAGRPLGFVAVERVLALPEGGTANLPGRVRAARREGWLAVFRPPEGPGRGTFTCFLPVPGVVAVPHGGGELRAELLDWPAGRDPASLRDTPAGEAYLDWHGINPPLLVRNRRPGDAFYPLGVGGRKKLQDFFTDVRVPREERDAVPLVCAGNDILWVVGYRIDERWRVRRDTRQVLHLVFLPAGNGPGRP